MAQKIVVELTEQLRMTQKARIEVLLDQDATPSQIDKVNKALTKARDSLADAVIDDLRDGSARVKQLTAKIKANTAKIDKELKGLKRTVALVKLAGDVVKLAVDVMRVVV